MSKVNVNDLDPETLKKFGIKPPRKYEFTRENVRSWSLKVLALMSELTQEQRPRLQ